MNTFRQMILALGALVLSLSAHGYGDRYNGHHHHYQNEGNLRFRGGLQVGFESPGSQVWFGPRFGACIGSCGVQLEGEIFSASWDDRQYDGYCGRRYSSCGRDRYSRHRSTYTPGAGVYDRRPYVPRRCYYSDYQTGNTCYDNPAPRVEVPEREEPVPPRRPTPPPEKPEKDPTPPTRPEYPREKDPTPPRRPTPPPRGHYASQDTDCRNAKIKCSLSGDYFKSNLSIIIPLGGHEMNRGGITCREQGKPDAFYPIEFDVQSFNIGIGVKNMCMAFRSPIVCEKMLRRDDGKAVTQQDVVQALVGEYQKPAERTHFGPSLTVGPASARAGVLYTRAGTRNNLKVGMNVSIPDREGCGGLSLNIIEHVSYLGVRPASDTCVRLRMSCQERPYNTYADQTQDRYGDRHASY